MMPNLNDTDFKCLTKQAKDHRLKLRLLALSHFKDGKSRYQIAGYLQVSRTSVNKWISQFLSGGLDAGSLGIMFEPPRRRTEPILPVSRLLKISAYGITMMVGTLGVLYFALQTGSEQRALTLAFTTFVLFQVFNVFNARNEFGSAFNPYLFSNIMLWASLMAVVVLQAIALHWPPAMAIFAVGGMTFSDWGIAYGVAASILVLEEGRKLLILFIKRLMH